MTAHAQPWRTLAPHSLSYTQSRVEGKRLVHRFDERAYRESYREMATQDLMDHLEHLRYLAVEYRDSPDNRAFAEILIGYGIDEITRRQRLEATGDPLVPVWPSRRTDFAERVAAVKQLWPIERMVTELLGCQLQRYGRDRRKARCPFHEERTPSFTVFIAEDRAWCFGCQQGGDVLDLAGLFYGYSRPIDRLECLERFAGIAPSGRVA